MRYQTTTSTSVACVLLTSDMSSGVLYNTKRLRMTISLVCTSHLNAANKIILFSYFYTFKIIKLFIACEASVIYSHRACLQIAIQNEKKNSHQILSVKFNFPCKLI